MLGITAINVASSILVRISKGLHSNPFDMFMSLAYSCEHFIWSFTEVALKTNGSEYGDSTSYSEDCDHVFGVEYAKGNAFKAINNTPDNVKEEYNIYAKPFLDSLGIKATPEVLLVSQTL